MISGARGRATRFDTTDYTDYTVYIARPEPEPDAHDEPTRAAGRRDEPEQRPELVDGAVFDNTVPHLVYRLSGKEAAVAEHIRTALEDPAATVPARTDPPSGSPAGPPSRPSTASSARRTPGASGTTARPYAPSAPSRSNPGSRGPSATSSPSPPAWRAPACPRTARPPRTATSP